MDPGLAMWITAAVFLHSLGTLGPYKTVWWWDHLTHALSSTVVAAAGYTAVRSLDEHTDEINMPSKLLFIFILIFVLAFGVVWELLEFFISGLAELFGSKTVLTEYGIDDTIKDLIFNTLGGLIVAVFGEIYLTDLVEQMVERKN